MVQFIFRLGRDSNSDLFGMWCTGGTFGFVLKVLVPKKGGLGGTLPLDTKARRLGR